MSPTSQIFDNHGRPISYLRIAVTDRCNLRCFYCMPEEGIHYLPKKELLTYEELLRLVRLLAPMGVRKVRITGGEPFVRNDLMPFIGQLHTIPGVEEIAITTNGVLTLPHIMHFRSVGITSVNLSLDTLDRERFKMITRRDGFEATMATLHALISEGIETKVNAVVMAGKNIEDIPLLVELSRQHPVSVRFIEEMPFNGEGSHYPVLEWHHGKILDEIKKYYPTIVKVPAPPHSTSLQYHIPGHQGSIGIIPAFTRSFCGTCNRIRLTAQGTLKTCLYDDGVLDLKKALRSGADDSHIAELLLAAFSNRPKDGYEAEQNRKIGVLSESMSTIGG